ncbi:hypothetical protein P7K49_021861 [Saguinus oedipus]|uniref:Uncharacterized protein n=1 Tax=Saguinus oedipus TaxID=9490 RepID=A0ABQ9UTU8_SAGOE|nr:hypothetical protein P7K49_021861 [Saguinus oedipus]
MPPFGLPWDPVAYHHCVASVERSPVDTVMTMACPQALSFDQDSSEELGGGYGKTECMQFTASVLVLAVSRRPPSQPLCKVRDVRPQEYLTWLPEFLPD